MNDPKTKKGRLNLMGAKVTASALVVRIHYKSLAVSVPHAVPLDESRDGWIVGFRTLTARKLFTEPTSHHARDEFMRGVPSIRCALVAFWPTSPPVPVPIDDLTFTRAEAGNWNPTFAPPKPGDR